MVGDNSDVIRRKKEAQRHRRLEPGEEDKLLRSAEPHLQVLIVAALETCGRQGELVTLRWGDVSLERGEIILRAEHTKNRENRILPISTRFRKVLEMRRDSPAGVPLPPSAHVFGDEIGQRIGNVRRAWQTAVLRAHGHKPSWIWKKKIGAKEKGGTRLSPESEAAYRTINLHFHGLRTKAARDCSRPVGPCTMYSTCSDTRRFSRRAPTSTRRSEDCTNRCGISINPAPPANRLQTDPPAASGQFASSLPPEPGSPSFTDCCSWRGRRDSNPRPPA
jgi:hypothetical protein